MADPTNLNNSSPGSFNQPTQSAQNALAPAQATPSTAAASSPPTAAPTTSTPISQTAGAGSASPRASGLGGGVSTPSSGMGGGGSTPPLVIGDSLLPGTPGPCTGGNNSSSGGGGTGSGQAAVYATPADLPAITVDNVRTQAIVTDIGNGTSGLYMALAIGPPTGWSFITVLL